MSEEDAFEIASRCSECSENETSEIAIENGKLDSRLKLLASHCFTLFTIATFKFTYGLDYGFTTIIIPELYKVDAEIKMSLDQLTWFSSYCFMTPVGALLGGFLTQCIGCRRLLVICAVSYITAGLIFYFSTNATMLLTAQIINGFIGGMQRGAGFTFLAEISLPKFRSVLMTCNGLGMMFGIFTSTALGTYLHWRTLALLNVIYPIVGLILVYFIPESPYWLASKNRYEDAKRSLAWFRGWTTPDCVETEMLSILNIKSDEDTTLSKNTKKYSTSNSKDTRGSLRQFAESYCSRSFYIPFLTVVFVFAVNNFNGIWPLTVFSVLIFKQINSPVDVHVAAIVCSAMRVLGSITSILLINPLGKRKLLFLTMTISGVVLTIAAIFGFAMTTNDSTPIAIYRWVPMMSIFATLFFTTMGLDKICLLLNSELFPLNARHVGVGAGQFVNSILISLVIKIFLYLVETVTLSGTFLLFAVVNIIGLVGTYFIVPETEGKSLLEIEKYYAGTQNKSKMLA